MTAARFSSASMASLRRLALRERSAGARICCSSAASRSALVSELEDYGVIRGELRDGTRYYDETEREIVRAVTELARYGVGGRNLRAFRTSADREAALLQQILAPALRSRNTKRRQEAIEALENLAAVTMHLKHLLLIRDLRKLAR